MHDTTDAADEYRTHDIILRDVVGPADAKCPDDMARGAIVASYRTTHDANATYTEAREVSTRLPIECLALFEDGRIDVADLTLEERRWLKAASAVHSNEIDFEGASTGPAVEV